MCVCVCVCVCECMCVCMCTLVCEFESILGIQGVHLNLPMIYPPCKPFNLRSIVFVQILTEMVVIDLDNLPTFSKLNWSRLMRI